MFDWKNILRGFLMGITDLVPGVSGGTVALLLGIYREFISSISGLMRPRNWKKSVLFLLPLGIGILTALLTVSGVIEWLLEHYPQPTFYFFLGLLLGMIPFLLRQIEYKKTFRRRHYILFLLAALLIALTLFVRENKIGTVMEDLTFMHVTYLFVSGWLASTAMILPGISGSFILLLLGVYPTFVHALSNVDIPVLFIIGTGILTGLIITSKVITYLLERFTVATYAVIIGMVTGSVVVIFPGIPVTWSILGLSIITLLLGFLSAMFLGRVENRQP